MIASEEPAAPSTVRAEVPAELERAVLACLVKKPEERGTLLQLARALVRFAPDRARASLERVEAVLGAPRTSLPLPVIAEKKAEVARTLQTQGSWGTERGRKRGGGGARVLLAVAALGVLGVGLYTGRISLRSLTRQVASATSTVASALPAPSNLPPLASVLESAASALAPIASAAASAALSDEPDASGETDDGEDEEQWAAAPSTSSGVVSTPWRPSTTPHPTTQPKRAPARPRHGRGGGNRKHH